jgi:hypothetical protein
MYLKTSLVALLGMAVYTIAIAGETKPTELQRLEWRICTTGARTEMVCKHAGKQYPVRVNFPGEPIGRTTYKSVPAPQKSVSKAPENFPVAVRNCRGLIRLAMLELHDPMREWIPPYIGLNSVKVNFSILPVSCTGKPNVIFEYDVGNQPGGKDFLRKQKNVNLAELPVGKWTDFSVSLDKSIPRRLTEVRFALNCKAGEKCEFYFSNISIIGKDGSSYDLLNTQEPSYLTGMKKPMFSGQYRHLPKRPQIHLGHGGPWPISRNRPYYAQISKFFKEYLPEYDIVFSASRTPEPIVAEDLKALPDNLFVQFQKAQIGIYYPSVMDALPKDFCGRVQPHAFNGIIATDQLIKRALKDQIDYAATLGFNNFKSYDYVWYFRDGRWGYDKATVEAFREDLQSKDSGLVMRSEFDGSVKTVKFWDYFREFHGMIFKPADLGLKSFADFVPPQEKELSNSPLAHKYQYSVFLALCSYEWLKLAQNFNRWAKAYNGNYDYILNGEVWPNASDHIGLMRLKDTGMISGEFFMHYPRSRQTTYHAYGRYVRAAQRMNKDIFYTLETTLGGGGGHPYWDLRTGYLVSYEMAAQGMTAFHYDHLEGWDTQNRNPLDKTAFNLFMSEARAFRQVRIDRVCRKTSNVLSVTPRSVAVRISPATHIDWGSRQWDPWNKVLCANYIDYSGSDPQELPALLNDTKVVFYAAPLTKPETASALEKWLAKGGKALIMHSYIPFSKENGRADYENIIREVIAKPGKSLFAGFDNNQPQGKCLLTDKKGAALLTEIPRDKGSFIYYLHRQPRNVSLEEMTKVMNFLCEKLSLARLQYPLKNGNAQICRYEGKDFSVITMWNRLSAEKGLKQLPDWLKNKWRSKFRFFDPDAYVYRYGNPAAQCSAVIPVPKAGVYRIYHFFEQKEETVTVGEDLRLTLNLKGANIGLFYVGNDSVSFRNHLKTIKAEQKKTEVFFKEQTQKWNVPGVPEYAPEEWIIVKQGKDPIVKDGVFSCVSTGPDVILHPRSQRIFAAKDYPLLIFELQHNANKETHFEIFWERRGGKMGENRSSRLKVLPDKQRKMYLLDLSQHPGWINQITQIRLDPVARPARFSLGNVRFLDPKREVPVPAHAWLKGGNSITDRKASAGLLTGKLPAGKKDPFISAVLPVAFDADHLKTVEFEVKLSHGCPPNGQFFFMAAGEEGFFKEKSSVRYKIPSDGQFHKVVLNLKNHAMWKGKISKIRLDMTTNAPEEGGWFELRNFSARR